MPEKLNVLEALIEGKKHPRPQLGFVKTIRNGLQQVKNLMEIGPTRMETGLKGERLELDFFEKKD